MDGRAEATTRRRMDGQTDVTTRRMVWTGNDEEEDGWEASNKAYGSQKNITINLWVNR